MVNRDNTPKKLSQETLDCIKANYTYDRDKGQVYSKRSGKPALGLSGKGYLALKVQCNGKILANIKTHHAVWFFEYGEWPTSCIDHIDGVKTNNHYTNLRLVTLRENSQAYRMSKRNKSSSRYVGVSFRADRKKYQADITINGKRQYLGKFICELEAARAYDKALVDGGLKPINIDIMEHHVVKLG